MSDPDLAQMIGWLKGMTLPKHFPKGKSHGLQSLWVQRQQMTLDNGILYHQWEDVQGGGRHRHLRLVVPRSQVDVILTEIHNACMLLLGDTLEWRKHWK